MLRNVLIYFLQQNKFIFYLKSKFQLKYCAVKLRFTVKNLTDSEFSKKKIDLFSSSGFQFQLIFLKFYLKQNAKNRNCLTDVVF